MHLCGEISLETMLPNEQLLKEGRKNQSRWYFGMCTYEGNTRSSK